MRNSVWSLVAVFASATGVFAQQAAPPLALETYSVSGPEIVVGSALHASSAALPTGPAIALDPSEADEVIEEYCAGCHSERMRRGDLVLSGFEVATAAENAPTAEKMILKLRAGMMPPAGQRRPDDAILQGLAASLEKTIDDATDGAPDPGSRPFQRLNRAEYVSAVQSLLGLDVNVDTYLPLDTKSANFDNIADAQAPSATLMEGVLRAAHHVARVALGDAEAEPNSTPYRVPRTQSQRERVEGAPFGTRGGISVVHNFPADGKYVFNVQPQPAVEGEVFGRTFPGPIQIDVSVDGERVALLNVDRWMSESEPTGLNIRTDSIYVKAGPHRVTAAYIRVFEGLEDDLIRPIDHTLADGQIGIGIGVMSQPHLQWLTVMGPYEITGISENEARRRVFTCRPTSPEEALPCAESIVSRLAAEAYRRALKPGDLESLMGFYTQGVEQGGFEGGIRMALQAILASPHFIFRFEEASADLEPGDTYQITDEALASRLAFFLWGSPPDAELIAAAEAGELTDSNKREEHVRRMLQDPRAEALSTRFAFQWLRLHDLEKIKPDALTFPYFDDTLAESMVRETELLFDHVVREDLSILELLTADYTFLDERLARHYKIPGVLGSSFRKVSYPDENRRGLLGHGGILTMTSFANRTSPVVRGKWVLEVLLGTEPPPPPPNVPGLEETEGAEDGRTLTVRERMEQHRSNPQCTSCHLIMDPIGLSLENFDVTGAWRVRDGGNLVDPVGVMFDGTPLAGPADLRAALLRRPEVFFRVFAQNMMAYALGRRVEVSDMPTVRSITAAAADDDYRVSSFVMGVVNSPAFLSGRVPVIAMDGAQGG
jgi:hypothetical protein